MSSAGRSSSRLTDGIARYHDRSVDALQVIQELIAIAKDSSRGW